MFTHWIDGRDGTLWEVEFYFSPSPGRRDADGTPIPSRVVRFKSDSATFSVAAPEGVESVRDLPLAILRDLLDRARA